MSPEESAEYRKWCEGYRFKCWHCLFETSCDDLQAFFDKRQELYDHDCADYERYGTMNVVVDGKTKQVPRPEAKGVRWYYVNKRGVMHSSRSAYVEDLDLHFIQSGPGGCVRFDGWVPQYTLMYWVGDVPIEEMTKHPDGPWRHQQEVMDAAEKITTGMRESKP